MQEGFVPRSLVGRQKDWHIIATLLPPYTIAVLLLYQMAADVEGNLAILRMSGYQFAGPKQSYRHVRQVARFKGFPILQKQLVQRIQRSLQGRLVTFPWSLPAWGRVFGPLCMLPYRAQEMAHGRTVRFGGNCTDIHAQHFLFAPLQCDVRLGSKQAVPYHPRTRAYGVVLLGPSQAMQSGIACHEDARGTGLVCPRAHGILYSFRITRPQNAHPLVRVNS